MRMLLIAPASEDMRVRQGEKPSWVNRVFRHSQQMGLLYVAAAAPPGVDVRILDEHVEPLEVDAPADLVGITCMTPHAPRAYAIADAFRARGRLVILGGYHASFLPQEALQHADAVCVGEAEGILPRVIGDLARGKRGGVYRNGAANLRRLPIPDRSLVRQGAYAVEAVQASRGCPHACSYCSDSKFFRHRHRTRPVEAVVEELKGLGRNLLFLDSNIIGDRSFAVDLFRAMAPLGKRWVSQCSIKIADDDELLSLAADSGCRGLFVGFETVSQANLESLHKRHNVVARYAEQVQRLHDRGIAVLAGLMFGMDDDGEDVFERTLDFLFRARIDAINPFVLTPFPGTKLFATLDAAGRIIDRDWRHYDFTHAVFHPTHMTPEALVAGRELVLREFYSTGRTIGRLLRCLRIGLATTVLGLVPLNAAYWHVARGLVDRRLDRDGRDDL